MEIVDFATTAAIPITQFASIGAASVRLGDGHGETHIYSIHLEPGGEIGEHPTGFGQLFLIIRGTGWVSGADRKRVRLTAGQAAFFTRGELHAKGSDDGMTAIMIQVRELALATPHS